MALWRGNQPLVSGILYSSGGSKVAKMSVCFNDNIWWKQLRTDIKTSINKAAVKPIVTYPAVTKTDTINIKQMM